MESLPNWLTNLITQMPFVALLGYLLMQERRDRMAKDALIVELQRATIEAMSALREALAVLKAELK